MRRSSNVSYWNSGLSRCVVGAGAGAVAVAVGVGVGVGATEGAEPLVATYARISFLVTLPSEPEPEIDSSSSIEIPSAEAMLLTSAIEST